MIQLDNSSLSPDPVYQYYTEVGTVGARRFTQWPPSTSPQANLAAGSPIRRRIVLMLIAAAALVLLTTLLISTSLFLGKSIL